MCQDHLISGGGVGRTLKRVKDQPGLRRKIRVMGLEETKGETKWGQQFAQSIRTGKWSEDSK